MYFPKKPPKKDCFGVAYLYKHFSKTSIYPNNPARVAALYMHFHHTSINRYDPVGVES